MSRPSEYSASEERAAKAGVTARRAGYLFAYVVSGAIASLAAVISGTILASLFSFGPERLSANFGVALMFAFVLLFSTFLAGFVCSMPTTFVLFPLWMAAFKGPPALRGAGLGGLGVAAGAVTMWLLWISSERYVAGESGYYAVLAGAIPGFVTAFVYRKVARMIAR